MSILFFSMICYLAIGVLFSLVLLPMSRQRLLESDNTTAELRAAAARLSPVQFVVMGLLWPMQVVSLVLATLAVRRDRKRTILIPCPGCFHNLDNSDGTHCTALDEGRDDQYLFRCGVCGVRSVWALKRPLLDGGAAFGRIPEVVPMLIGHYDETEENPADEVDIKAEAPT